MTYKLDLFTILHYLDTNTLEIYEAMRENTELLKELKYQIPWLLPQWVSGSYNNKDHEELINNFNLVCNDNWYELNEHPELQLKLLACCGLGKETKHRFFKPQTSKKYKNLLELLSTRYTDLSAEEAKLWCNIHTKKDIIDLGKAYGYQEKELMKLKKEFTELKSNI